MRKGVLVLGLLLAILLASSPLVLAESTVADMPLKNVYDPEKQRNRPITDYTFEELERFLIHPRFKIWGDTEGVCESMIVMFGKQSRFCADASVVLPPASRHVTTRGYATFEILPPPHYIVERAPITPLHIIIEPQHFIWAPVYDPLGPRW